MRAISIDRHGGPEVMQWTELPDPAPGKGEVLVRLAVAGVNFMDVGPGRPVAPVGPLPRFSGSRAWDM